MKVISDVNSLPWLGKAVNSNFRHYQSRGNSTILCLHSQLFKLTFKPISYLTSISCRGPVNPSTPTLANINLTKANKNLLVVSKITEKRLQ